MKTLKTQKGITLVALVITIIVLLILAIVAIGAVRDSGIIVHAQNSAYRYNTGKDEEDSMLSNYENVISDYENGGGPEENEEAVWGECYGTILYIGTNDTLNVTNEMIQVETIEVDFQNYTYTRTGEIKTAKISDYNRIGFILLPSVIKRVDFGGKLTSFNEVIFTGDDQKGGKTIESVTGLDGIAEIADSAFENCDLLTNITIPNSVNKINKHAFSDCTALKNITIPNEVVYIGKEAFLNCTNLTTINYKGTREEWNQISIGSSAFYSLASGAKVICSDGEITL